MADIAERLREFFIEAYRQTVVPALESATGKKFDEIPAAQKPYLGLVLGGFSTNAFLSEVGVAPPAVELD